MIRQIALASIAGASLAACSYIPGTDANRIERAQKQVAALMKDPSSAQFEQVRVSPDKYVCGYVNAKNSYGAYEGKEGFIVNPNGGEVTLQEPPSSGNPGIDATNACIFKQQLPACLAGKQLLQTSIKIASDRTCNKLGQEALDEFYKEKAKLLPLGAE